MCWVGGSQPAQRRGGGGDTLSCSDLPPSRPGFPPEGRAAHSPQEQNALRMAAPQIHRVPQSLRTASPRPHGLVLSKEGLQECSVLQGWLG